MHSVNNSITELLGIKNVLIEKVEEIGNKIEINISTAPKYLHCPVCGKQVTRIHDYRLQHIKDLPFRNKVINLVLNKRRYRCNCGKRFFEKYSFLPKYHRMTQRVYESILRDLRSNVTYKSVSEKYDVSHNIVTRIFDLVKYKLYKLPEIIGIDEFKGNSGGEKYQCILTNPSNHKVLDILPTREKHDLIEYFQQFERKNVRIFVMDMWEQYRDIAEIYFKNAMIVVDKYHYVRQVNWALNGVRKRIQNQLTQEERLDFKRQRWILEKDYRQLNNRQRARLERMLEYNEDLKNAWELKEIFNTFRYEKEPDAARKKLLIFIEAAKEVGLQEYEPAITAFTNWFEYIINSKRTEYTNAFTEGTNNKIKVLKRVGYGYWNFERFRNRILHLN